MKSIIYILLSLFALISCEGRVEHPDFGLQGVWILESKSYAYDQGAVSYDMENKTYMRIYDDSCYYECQIMAAPSGKMLTPTGWEHYTLIDRGQRNYLYLQEDNTQPLTVTNDSTIIIQETGCKFKWKLYTDFDNEKIEEIRNIIKFDINDDNEAAHRYIFSYAERQLLTANHTLIYILIGILLAVLLLLNYFYRMYQNKKRVEQQLQLLEQEREAIPEPVREAMSNVEEDFLQSEFYTSLRAKITRGDRITKAEWNELEEHFQHVYPRFASSLLTLCSMSLTEFQVCRLLKLGCSPSEIANVLCKDVSSISSIRSRLYKKVFGRKGSSKDWDEFIHSL